MDAQWELLEQALNDQLDMTAEEFRDALRTNASVLLLGQKYQSSLFGREFFLAAAQQALAGSRAALPADYTRLWKENTARKPLLDGVVEYADLTEEQQAAWNTALDQTRLDLQEQVPDQLALVNRMLHAGWRLVATSAPETTLTGLPGSPFSPNKTVLHPGMSMPQSFRASALSLLQMYAPGKGLHLRCYEEEDDPLWEEDRQGSNFLYKALERAMPYNGYLVLDGWDPSDDWFGQGQLIQLLDQLINQQKRSQIKVICFGLSAAQRQALTPSDPPNRQLVRRIVFLDGHLTDLFVGLPEPEPVLAAEDFYHLHLLPVKNKLKPLDLSVPVQEWQNLPFAANAALLPLEPRPEGAVREQLGREVRMTAFLAQNRELPLWDDYEDCYFERDLYPELLQRARHSLAVRGPRQDFMLLKGPACSGKTVLLGKLALDLSLYYPTIFLGPSALPRDPDDNNAFAQLCTFILEQFTKPMGNRKFNSKRVLVIWDGGFYETEAREIYQRLRRQLQQSTEFLLIGSAYASPRGTGSDQEGLALSARLSREEEDRLCRKLQQNLGLEDAQIRKALTLDGGRRYGASPLAGEENTLLSVLSHLFRGVNEDITFRLTQAPMQESQAAHNALMNRVLDLNIDQMESARQKGAVTSALQVFNCDWSGQEDQSQLVADCAGILDDILAVAGFWRQPLHFELVFRVMQDLYQKRFGSQLRALGIAQTLLNTLLDYSPMISWEGEDPAVSTLRYRSALEAEFFLESKYPHHLETDEEYALAQVMLPPEEVAEPLQGRPIARYTGPAGQPLREEVAIQVLCSVLCNGNLNDGANDFAYEALHLADCFGPNAGRNADFLRWYPYIAMQLVEQGSRNVAALQKAAFLLRHYDWEEIKEAQREAGPAALPVLLDEVHFQRQLQVAALLQQTITLAEDPYHTASPRQKVQLYTEWCCNRRLLYCPQADFAASVPEGLRPLLEKRLNCGDALLQEVEATIRDKLIPLSAAADEYGGPHIVGIYNDMMVATVQTYETFHPRDLQPLADHMNFYWQRILFGLLDLGVLVEERNDNQLNEISRILETWSRLSHGTQWGDTAQKQYRQQEADLYRQDAGSWWTNRITSLWHEPLPGQPETTDYRDWLCNNLYLRSLAFQPEESARLDPGTELRRARYIAAAMEGTPDPDGLPGLTPPEKDPNAQSCLEIITTSRDNHLRLQEYYLRAKWMAETGFFPYADMTPVCLLDRYWKDIRAVCDNYCQDLSGVGNDFFPFYLRAVLQWVFTRNPRDVQCRRQPAMFRACSGRLRTPRNGRYNTSYLLLCWSDHTPVTANCVVNMDDKSGQIQNVLRPGGSVTEEEYRQLEGFLRNKYLYVADTVADIGQGNNYTFGIRFNREGPVAAPLASLRSKGGTN